MKVLFLTWDGPQTTYLESLFLPIFKKLAETGLDFHILQFTWGDPQRIEARRQACVEAGFSYQAVAIWRRPLAVGGLLSALNGARLIRKALRDHQIDVVMPRSTLPALATLLALRSSSHPMIFDADGLPLDERVDFTGQSPSNFMYRLLRDIEAQAVRRANVVLTRSAKAADILLARAGAGTSQDKFHVVGNGRDADLFKPVEASIRLQVRQKLMIAEDIPLLVYAGSMGSQYCLGEMLQLFSHVRQRRPDAHLLILTGSPEWVTQELAAHQDIVVSITTLSVPFQAVPEYLASADLGLALRQPSFSMQAVAPIKLGEYLLCGLPVVATAGVGDTDAISSADTGFLVAHMDSAKLKAAADWFIDCVLPQREAFRNHCRAIGVERFSLEACTQSYKNAMAQVAGLLGTN
ncbi:MAG: glycosyltransferase, partial [Halothiobacillus sp.]|nr:glycosyltransferase [Halothiobacillus sp.]